MASNEQRHIHKTLWRRMKTLKRAVDEINNIGGPDDIAQYLKERNIKGQAASGCGCPLAIYLTQEVGKTVRVTGISIYLSDFFNAKPNRDIIFTPENLLSFITKTDRLEYPFLLESEIMTGKELSTNKWSAQPNDLVGGWIVTRYPHPLSQHDHSIGDNPDKTKRRGYIIAECNSRIDAEHIAILLNQHESRQKKNDD